MLLTWPMVAAGIVTGVLEFIAHGLMADRTYLTPIPRYIVGVLLALAPWSLAILIEPGTTESIIVSVWYVFGVAAIATWLGYELDRKQPTEADVARLADFIAGEHDETTASD